MGRGDRRRGAQRAVVALALGICGLLCSAGGALARDVYVANLNDNPDTVSVFDIPSNGPVGAKIPLGLGNLPQPTAIAFIPDGSSAYVVNNMTNNVSVISAAAHAVVGGPISTGAGTTPSDIAISPDGAHAYVTNSATNTVSVIDTASNTVVGSPISLPVVRPTGIAVTPDGTRVYVANGGPFGDSAADSVSVIDTTTNSVVGSPIPVGDQPAAVAVTPDGTRAYVANGTGAGSVSVIDTATNATIGLPIAVGMIPRAIAITPDGSRAYVVNTTPTGSVSVIGTASNTVVAPAIPVDSQATRIAISPDGTRAYVTGFNLNRVTVIDTAANAVVGAPIPTGAGASGIAITPNQGPVAAFAVSPAQAGSASGFDASGSSDPDGTIVRYDWDFGDGASLADGGPTPAHVYANPGTYTASLTVTDNEGCSTRLVFTGQTAMCNAGPSGQSQQQLTAVSAVPDTTSPELSLAGRKKQKLDGAVEVSATCSEDCTAVGKGSVAIKFPGSGGKSSLANKRFKLKRTSGQIAAGQTLTLKLKVPFKARIRGLDALKDDAKLTASIGVTASDTAGNATPAKRKVRLTLGPGA
jgi:YVTN family beta-propeller protein